ncbi:MAG: endonuclease/exonuclease/phosphatase family protein, partial [Pirellula sp.]
QGNPANDTGDFNDKNPGNLRIDFVLPSANLKVLASGVYWPSKSQSPESAQLVNASDHRLVWVDIQITP